jgi:hypothetical protein
LCNHSSCLNVLAACAKQCTNSTRHRSHTRSAAQGPLLLSCVPAHHHQCLKHSRPQSSMQQPSKEQRAGQQPKTPRGLGSNDERQLVCSPCRSSPCPIILNTLTIQAFSGRPVSEPTNSTSTAAAAGAWANLWPAVPLHASPPCLRHQGTGYSCPSCRL